MIFSLLNIIKDINCGQVKKMSDALHYILDNIFIRFGSIYRDKLYVFQWVLVVLLLWQICFCFVMGDFMLSLSDNNQADVIEVFDSVS